MISTSLTASPSRHRLGREGSRFTCYNKSIVIHVFLMEWFWRIVIGLLISAIGVSLTFKTQWYLRLLGRVPFAEKVFGSGGTRLFYKLFGALMAIIGFMVMTDLMDNFLEWLIGGMFG